MPEVTTEVIRDLQSIGKEEMDNAVEALEGVVRCHCGVKYWDNRGDGVYCADCGTNAVDVDEAWAVVHEAGKRIVARLGKAGN